MWCIQPLLGRDLEKKRARPSIYNRRINKRSFLGNRSVNTIEERLKAVFSVGSAPRLYNEDPRTDRRDLSSERVPDINKPAIV
jgi:hypothetical protein